MANLTRAIIECLSGSTVGRIKVIAISEEGPDRVDIEKTAEFLRDALVASVGRVDFETYPVSLADNCHNGNSEINAAVAKIMDVAQVTTQDCDVLILVVDKDFAGHLPNSFIWDVLKNHCIIREAYQIYNPGWAGIVDCALGNRNTIMV